MNDPIVWLILDPCSKGGYWVLPKVKHNIPAPILDREKRLNTWIKELLSLLSSRLQIINNFFFAISGNAFDRNCPRSSWFWKGGTIGHWRTWRYEFEILFVTQTFFILLLQTWFSNFDQSYSLCILRISKTIIKSLLYLESPII